MVCTRCVLLMCGAYQMPLDYSSVEVIVLAECISEVWLIWGTNYSMDMLVANLRGPVQQRSLVCLLWMTKYSFANTPND